MANPSTAETFLTGIPDQAIQGVLKSVFRYILGDIRFGRATGTGQQSAASVNAKATNLGGGYLVATTPAVANTEFAVAHNFGHAPYLCIPVLPLDQVNAGIARLVVSRAADASNLYFKSADAGLPIFLYVEG